MNPQLERAFSQALRVEILERIARDPASPRAIAEATGEPLARIAYHTAILHRSGCVQPVDSADAESRECVYELSTLLPNPPRIPLSDSTRGHALASVLRRIVDQGVAALKAGTIGTSTEPTASCESMQLDERGWQETRAILAETTRRLAETKAAAAERLARNGELGTPTTVGLAAFEAAPGSPRRG